MSNKKARFGLKRAVCFVAVLPGCRRMLPVTLSGCCRMPPDVARLAYRND